ncbi:hypothetical protein [Methylobacterium tardum]|uniref:Uncharacterized protein n=1 Tax=Methylobacterium tardum TaxID=374432 RepID=A0AA37TIY7_9HYPH|nr:hypothetical protein [Methylobacterium tardum]URD34585.1 hypothetical protein M6G65_18470 [Methylobacterium tardum]GLS73027.1 hypothetical protein GCM10007890_50420 [Methylobacterium tardum]
MGKKLKLKIPEGYDLEIEFVEVDDDAAVVQNEKEAQPITEDDQGNLAWNGCGCGGA